MTHDELLHFLLYLFLVDLFTFIFSALLCAFTLLIACPFVHASVLQNFFGYLFCCFFVAFVFAFCCFCVSFFLWLRCLDLFFLILFCFFCFFCFFLLFFCFFIICVWIRFCFFLDLVLLFFVDFIFLSVYRSCL